MTRKEFLGSLVGALSLFACAANGDDGGGDPVGGGGGGGGGTSGGGGGGTSPDAGVAKSCSGNGTSVTIGTNHGHTLVVSKTDVAAGQQKTYDITGTSSHAHSVTITAAQFAMLQSNANASVTVTSMGGAHDHAVTIVCA